MQFLPSSIPDVILIQPRLHGDARGFFMETYHAQRFAEAGIDVSFPQDNHSGSKQGVLRGLHYQIRRPQGKLVRCVAGEIFDVAVDIRRSSPTFGRWTGAILSADNKYMLWVPAGFAHGFYVLSDWAELAYKASDFYAPEWDRSVRWNDPQIGIEWPLLPAAPIISEKDKNAPPLSEAEIFD